MSLHTLHVPAEDIQLNDNLKLGLGTFFRVQAIEIRSSVDGPETVSIECHGDVKLRCPAGTELEVQRWV